MSRRAIKGINWAAMAEKVKDSDKPVFAAFKAKSDQYLRRMMANPESQPKIDWDYYKKTIATPGLVDKFRKEYESLQIPYPADKYTAKIDADHKETAVKMEKFVESVHDKMAECRKEIERIQGLLPFDQMTMEDFQECYPEYAWNPENPSVWPHIPEVQNIVLPPKGDPGGH